MTRFDLFVIGGGSGGVACARRAAAYGARVALCEASRVGGTCVIRGCVPKKLMHYGAHFAEAFRAARAYGWSVGEPGLDFKALLEARNAEIARLNGIYIDMLTKAGVAIMHGRGTVTGRDADGAWRIEVAGEEYTAGRVLIAVGARPSLPEVPGVAHAITSDEALEDIYEFPRRAAVVGAGYIGVELASILAGFGSETSLIYRRELPLRGFDEDIRSELATGLAEHGVVLRPSTVVDTVEAANDGIRVRTDTGDLDVDLLLYATGRAPVPNTRGIGLEALGVDMDKAGAIRVGAEYESSVAGIHAVGDCSDHTQSGPAAGGFDLTPVAIAEGRALAERLFNDNPQTVAYDTVPTAVFSVPQVGSAGLSEDRAREAGYDVQVFRTAFRPMLHTLTGFSRRSMMKVVVDRRTDRVLGCHMVGDDAAEIIQGLAVALTAGVSKSELDATVGVHPTAAEEFVTLYQPAA